MKAAFARRPTIACYSIMLKYCSTTLILRSPFPSLLYIGAIAPNSISPRIINKNLFFLFVLDVRGVLGNKCTGHHNLKRVKTREII